MALAPGGRFGLGAVPPGVGFPPGFAPSPFSGPAALREKFYPAKYGGYPSDVLSRIPDNADWVLGISNISPVDLPGGTFLAPGDSGGHYLLDANKVVMVWDQNGHLVSQFDVGGTGGGPQYATSLQAAYDPANSAFGRDIQLPSGGFQRFDPVQATSVAGRMANLGEDQATATARAAAASKILGVAVKPLPVKAPPPPPPPSYATPPGMKLPVNTPPPPPPPTPPQVTLPVAPSKPIGPTSGTNQPTMQTPELQIPATTDTPVTVPTIASVAADNAAATPPATAGFGGIGALLLGGGLLFALTRKGKR